MVEKPLSKSIYVGVAFVAMSTLMLELVLIRIFSVTLWYHFAFMAISIALLGMGASGIFVYLQGPISSPEKTLKRLSASSLVCSITIVLALIVQLNTKFVPTFSPKGFLLLAQAYLVIAVPFFFGGYCISLVLTQFSRSVSKLYFADLVGAGIGCFLVIPSLSVLTGPGAVIVAAVLSAVSAWIFASAAQWRAMRNCCAAVLGGLLVLLFANSRANFLRVEFVKGHKEKKPIIERWNPFSRVTVAQWPKDDPFRGWGPSRAYDGPQPNIMMISIDAHASTPIYEFDGDLNSVRALEYDSSGIAYELKRGGDKALVIGPGGGKDVLTALLYGIKFVRGVEINPTVVELVENEYADFSGRLYHMDNVDIVVDEGRSYIARSSEKFDIIQASQVDSWAATAAGAFVLTENNLYTLEAFQQYYDHLTDDGILTMTRFFFDKGGGQTLRLTALAYEAWKANGVANPEKHIVVIRNFNMGTVLFKKSEFTTEELTTLEDLCRRLKYRIVSSPRGSSHPAIRDLFASKGSESFYRGLSFNMAPPDDDKPFFFHMLRMKDFFRPREKAAGLAINDNAIFVLGYLLIIVTVLSLLFIVGPLWTFKREALRQSKGKWGFIFYFTCLGVGFMMVEVPLMQKMLLFLGHPIYALSVTLFGILIFSGLGSYATSFLPDDKSNRWLSAILLLLSAVLVTYILVLPYFIHRLIALPTLVKIPLVVLALFPLGFLLGMPFPMGVKLVDRQVHDMIPWVWGINGATSVFASVFSIAVAINWGFSVAMAVGLFAYLSASVVVNLKSLKQPE